MIIRWPGLEDKQKWSDSTPGDHEMPSTDEADSVKSEPASPSKKGSHYSTTAVHINYNTVNIIHIHSTRIQFSLMFRT